MGDVLDPVECSKTLGKILGMQIRYDEATDVLQEAQLRAKFVEIGNVLGAAQCFQSLGDNLYMQNQYGKTTTVLEEARSGSISKNVRTWRSNALQCISYTTLALKTTPVMHGTR